jgi:hypothetical protein
LIERKVGGCFGGVRIAFLSRFGDPAAVSPDYGSGVLYAGCRSARARFMFMAVVTNRRWQALREARAGERGSYRTIASS